MNPESRDCMRVTIIAPGPESEGGIRSVVASIVPRLQERNDMNVTWIASHRSGSAISRIACFLTALVKSIYYLPRSSVVHVHGAVSTSLLRKSIFIWLSSFFRCDVIYHFHAPQHIFERYFARPGLTRDYSLATLKRCKAIAVLSESWADLVKKVLPDSEIVVIYNPVPDIAGVQKNVMDDSRAILYLAHLIERKGYLDLIRALPEVIEQVPDVRLVLCGSGEVERAQELCKDLGILDHVDFHGWVSDTEKVNQLSRATVFCLPSYDEGLPMGILEAMSTGVAVVATPVGGIPDVLTNEVNALLAEPGDVSKLSEQLIRLLTQSDLRNRLAAKALEDSSRFNPGRVTEAWVTLYQSVDHRKSKR